MFFDPSLPADVASALPSYAPAPAPTGQVVAVATRQSDDLLTFANQYPRFCAICTFMLIGSAVFGNVCRLFYKEEMEKTRPRLAGFLKTGITIGNVAIGVFGPLYQFMTGRKLEGGSTTANTASPHEPVASTVQDQPPPQS